MAGDSNTGGAELASGMEFSVLSLFAGCGGLDLGFLGDFNYMGFKYSRLPFTIVKAYDNDPRCVETYSMNLGQHIELADLALMPASEMPSADVVIGGFPCQDFSSCGPLRGLESERGRLYRAFVRYLEAYQPKVVVAENVPHLSRMGGGQVLETIVNDLESPGYTVRVWFLEGPKYGVPQNRNRLFLVGVRNDLAAVAFPDQPKPTHPNVYRSIEWAIDDLVRVTDGSVPNQDQYFLAARAKRGNGQGDEISRRDEPAYTVRANPKSRVQFHYELPRRLTVRECARIQTFPDSFVFPHSTTVNMMQIGNAVPPILAHHVGRAIAEFLFDVQALDTKSPGQVRRDLVART